MATALSADAGRSSAVPLSIGVQTHAQLQKRDPRSWGIFVTLWSPAVYSWCRRLGLPASDAAEVTQEVFISLFKSGIDRFRRDGPDANFHGWLYTVTKHAVADHWRQRQRQPGALGGSDMQEILAAVPAPPDSGLEGMGPISPLVGQLRRALTYIEPEFTPQEWQRFERHVLDGIDVDTVARALGTSPNAVYLAKSRVLMRLREMLVEFGFTVGTHSPSGEAKP